MVFASLSFLFVLIKLDDFLQRTGRDLWQAALMTGRILAGFLLIPALVFVACLITLDVSRVLSGLDMNQAINHNLFTIYSTMTINGLLVLLLVTILTLLARFVLSIAPKIHYDA